MRHGKIDKDIPIPTKMSKSKYMPIFEQMKVGESTLFEPESHDNPLFIYHRLQQAAYRAGKQFGRKYALKRTEGDKPLGVRIWRIK